jgi:hypothetical protein
MIKKIKNNLWGIIIGIVASIIFTRLIDPNWNKGISIIGNFIASLSKSFVDYLYENTGDGIREIFSYLPYTLVGIIFLVPTLFLMIYTISSFYKSFKTKKNIEIESKKEKKEEIKKRTRKIHKFELFVMSIAASLIFCYFLSKFIKDHYTYNLTIYIEKSLDIVAPYLNNQERLILKANYRLIDNYEKFNYFNKNLDSIAKENNIVLPKFELIVK